MRSGKKSYLKEEDYICEDCGMKFRNKMSFDQHKREHELYHKNKNE